MHHHRRRRCAPPTFLDPLEPRQLLSGITKLPDLAWLRQQANPVINLPSSPTNTEPPITAPYAHASAPLSIASFDKNPVVGESTGGILALLKGSYRLPGDPGTALLVQARISWGDGTSELASLSRVGIEGEIGVSGFHAYRRPGNYTLTVTAIYSSDVVNPLALIYVPPPDVVLRTTVAVAVNSPGGRTLNSRNRQVNGVISSIPNLGNFDQASRPQLTISRPAKAGQPATVLRASITWGDGTTGTALLRSNAAGGYDILGSHTYAAIGSYRISIYIAAAYNGGPFVETIRTIRSLALAGNIPGNLPPFKLSFPLFKYTNLIPID